jgi:hypothetical protein
MKKHKFLKISIIFIVLICCICSVGFFISYASMSAIFGIPTANLPNYKLQALLKQQQLFDTAAQQPIAPKVANYNDKIQAITITPDEIQPTGILNGKDIGSEPFPSRIYTANNEWVGNINNIQTQIFAGYCTQNPNQGVVIVFQPDGLGMSYYKTSALDGGLTITKVDGNVLTLTCSTGNTYTFDMTNQLLTPQ